MSYKRRGLLLSVKDLHFTHKEIAKKNRAYLLRAFLLLPRTNVESKNTLRVLDADPKGKLITEDSPLHESTLFKQSVEGPFTIGVQLSKAVSKSGLSKIMPHLAETSIELAGSIAATQVIPPLRSAIRGSASFFAGRLTDNEPSILSEGFIDISDFSSHTLTLELFAAEAVSVAPSRRGKSGRRKNAKTLAEKGDSIATATLQLEFF